MKIEIDRLCNVPFDRPKETLGVMYLVEDNKVVFDCKTLELPWKDNENRVSCIPVGKYKCSFYNSPTKGKVLLLKDVPNRSMIEVHSGNYYTQILGCILVGEEFRQINKDGIMDVSASKKTLKEILKILEGTGNSEFDIEISYRGS